MDLWPAESRRAVVSHDEIETYRCDGAVLLRGVVPTETLAALAAGVEANLADPSPWANDYTPQNSHGDNTASVEQPRKGRFFDDYVNWQRIPPFREAALTGILPAIAGALMATARPRFFHEHVLVKEPGTATPTPWHHDDPYYGVDGLANVSLWVPLDPIPESIALRCLAASHATGQRFVPNRFVDDTPYIGETEITNAQSFRLLKNPSSLEQDPAVKRFPAVPGDVVAFHFRTLHGAPGTTHHPNRRRVVSFRYVGDDARWATRPWTTSPPFPANGLVDGDELDTERFPVINLS